MHLFTWHTLPQFQSHNDSVPVVHSHWMITFEIRSVKVGCLGRKVTVL